MHAQEPWRIELNILNGEYDCIVDGSEPGKLVGQLEHHGTDPFYTSHNGQRLVDCVNALADIKDVVSFVKQAKALFKSLEAKVIITDFSEDPVIGPERDLEAEAIIEKMRIAF